MRPPGRARQQHLQRRLEKLRGMSGSGLGYKQHDLVSYSQTEYTTEPDEYVKVRMTDYDTKGDD